MLGVSHLCLASLLATLTRVAELHVKQHLNCFHLQLVILKLIYFTSEL